MERRVERVVETEREKRTRGVEAAHEHMGGGKGREIGRERSGGGEEGKRVREQEKKVRRG
jgi:hypothetical protein